MLSKRLTETSCLPDSYLTTVWTHIQNYRDFDFDAITVVDGVVRSIAVSSVMIVVIFLDSPLVEQSCVTKIELTMVLEGENAVLRISPGTAPT